MRLQIKNSNSNPAYLAFSANESLNGAIEYTYNRTIDKEKFTWEIPPLSTTRVVRKGGKKWRNFVRLSKNQELHLFYISKDIFDNYNWDDIINKRLYKELFIPLSELEKNDWLVDLKNQ